MTRKHGFIAAMIAFVLCAGFALAFIQKGDEAVGRLMDGNKRFVAGSSTQPDLSDARKKELAGGQHPSAIVVTCSDSRVAPEHIFNQGLGDIFVIRTAGNVLDPIALGSVEYAAEHLHTPLLVIMGHEKCGAVAAAMEAPDKPEGNIGSILVKILPAVKKAKASGGTKEEMLDKAIRRNVVLSHNAVLKQSPVLKHLAEEGELKVIEALYHLTSGEVEILATSEASSSHHELVGTK